MQTVLFFFFYPQFHSQQENMPLKKTRLIWVFFSSSLMSMFPKHISCFKKWKKEKKSLYWFEIMCVILSFRRENNPGSSKDSSPYLCSVPTSRAQRLDIASSGNNVWLGEVTRYCKCSIGVLFLSSTIIAFLLDFSVSLLCLR